jgi:alpha-1,2-mannosyltransferase
MHDGRWKQAMDIERTTQQLEEVHTYVAGTMRRCTQLASSAKYRLEQQFSARPSFKEALYISLVVLFLLIALINYFSRRRTLAAPTRPSTPSIEKASTAPCEKGKGPYRVPGTWTPVPFVRPTPAPYPDWSIETTKPLPYRPFRYKNFVTMGLRSLPSWDDWIELDNHYPRFWEDKKRRIIERGEKCCRTDPDAFDGAVELLEEFCSYLPARYPSLYRKTDVGMDNLWSGESFDIVERPLKEDPMQMAARMVQDDLAIMFEKPDGQYYLLAGAILLAGFWRLEDKWKMPLSQIHTSGDVPQFKEKLEKGMMNFFRRVQPSDPVSTCPNRVDRISPLNAGPGAPQQLFPPG